MCSPQLSIAASLEPARAWKGANAPDFHEMLPASALRALYGILICLLRHRAGGKGAAGAGGQRMASARCSPQPRSPVLRNRGCFHSHPSESVSVPPWHLRAPSAAKAADLKSSGSSSPSPKALAEQGSLIICIFF